MTYKLAIVGHAGEKFNDRSHQIADEIINSLLRNAKVHYGDFLIFVSGRSPMGGIDVVAEELANILSIETDIKVPKQHSWDGQYGFKARNLDIAKSDSVHVIVVAEYPDNFKGMKHDNCYHCAKHNELIPKHVKSGGCWTAWEAYKKGKNVYWHIIRDREVITVGISHGGTNLCL